MDAASPIPDDAMIASHIKSSPTLDQGTGAVDFAPARSVGDTWLLTALWKKLGFADAFRRILRNRRQFDTERLLRVMVFNRLCDPESKLGILRWLEGSLVANRAPLEPPNRGLMEPVKGVVFRVPDGVIFGGFPGILQTSESLYLRRGDQRATQSYPRPPARRAFPGELAGGRRWVTRLARTTVIRVAVFTP